MKNPHWRQAAKHKAWDYPVSKSAFYEAFRRPKIEKFLERRALTRRCGPELGPEICGTNGREVSHESRSVLWRNGTSIARIWREYSQASGSDRISADPLACNEVLRALRTQRFHPVSGLPWRCHQELFFALR